MSACNPTGEKIANALAAIEQAGLYVSWCCQGTDDKWHVTLRRQQDQPFTHNARRTVYVRRGKGATMADALHDAATEDFADVLG